MSPITVGIIGLICFVLLMVIGIPIPFSMLLVGFTGCIILRNPVSAVQILVSELTTQFCMYGMTVGALFGLMGFIANYTGVGKELFNVVNKYIGHWRGGLAMATQVACAGFGAICGSVPATIGAFSAIAYPEMKERKYESGFAGASISAGAQISTVIPPSATFLVYCMATNTSVGKQFLAGIIPGILLMITNCLAIHAYIKLRPEVAPASDKASWKERIQALRSGSIIQIAVVFIISMGGMFAGLFTPTEAGAVGAFGMILVTLFSRQLNLKRFMESAVEAVELHTMVLVLLGCANVFSRFINMTTIPTAIGTYCKTLLERGMPDKILMFVIIAMFFMMGMFVDLISVTLMTIPIFYPIVVGILGYSPIWFGIIITLVICLGGITPPMGTSVFMMKNACRDSEMTLTRAFGASVPYFFSFLFICILLICIPSIVTFLPNLMMGI